MAGQWFQTAWGSECPGSCREKQLVLCPPTTWNHGITSYFMTKFGLEHNQGWGRQVNRHCGHPCTSLDIHRNGSCFFLCLERNKTHRSIRLPPTPEVCVPWGVTSTHGCRIRSSQDIIISWTCCVLHIPFCPFSTTPIFQLSSTSGHHHHYPHSLLSLGLTSSISSFWS